MKVAEFWASGFFLTQAESLISSDLHTIYSLDRVTVMGCIVQIKVTVLTSPQPQKRTGANRNVTRLGGRGGGGAGNKHRGDMDRTLDTYTRTNKLT